MPPRRALQQKATPQHAASSRLTLRLGLLGSLLSYLAHPPMGLSLLAWIGPIPWFYLARLPRLPGRRPYLALWVAGALFWLATVQWIRLPHPANIFGLFLLAAYLGAYLPLAVGLARVAVHQVGLPMWLAAPVAWTGLEWLRARLLTGFLMASLAHTQIRFPIVIQIADLFGEYGVTFLIMLVAASIAEALPLRWLDRWRPDAPQAESPVPRGADFRLWKLAPAVVALAAACGYGYAQFRHYGERLASQDPSRPASARIALVQSDMLADWKGTAERDVAVMAQMLELSRKAVAAPQAKIDLVVWPETMFRLTLHGADGTYRPPYELFTDEKEKFDETFTAATNYLRAMARDLDVAVLVGLDRSHWRKPAADATPNAEGVPPFVEESFNSSACFDRTGALVGTYDKMHLLPFGEYIPFVRWLPFLKGYSPITGGALPGQGPAAIEVGDVTYSPNICYETVLPHLIRRQVAELAEAGQTPDVLVNLTNDAWYWGSSELDMHLASGVFRAVEMRTPLVVAANRGLSAHVDHLGRIVDVTERDVPAVLVAKVSLPPRRGTYPSPFAAYGDWLALVCLICCIVLAIVGWLIRRSDRPAERR